MLAEKEIENTLGTAVLPSGGEYGLVKSRAGVQVETADKIGVVTVAVGTRSHDNFSLPTLNFTGQIVVATRKELDPTGAKHEAAVESVFAALSLLHDVPDNLATLFASSTFQPAALRLDGGQMPDLEGEVLTDAIGFTLRGVLAQAAPEPVE